MSVIILILLAKGEANDFSRNGVARSQCRNGESGMKNNVSISMA
jgi:hypothetical protein